MAKTDIFISYRRQGGEFLGKILYDELTRNGYSVFYDVEAMNSGKFNEQILKRIDECSDFLLLLTQNCLNRCVNKDDWVRKEIECALKLNKKIIPIVTRDFVFPQVLPPSMKDLPLYEQVEATGGDMEFVMKKLKRLISAKPQNSVSDMFSELSIPAITPTVVDFIRKGGSMKDLLLFEGDINITDYWQNLLLDLSSAEYSYKKSKIEKEQDSLFKTLSALYDMKIIGSAPINKLDFWYDTVGNNEIINFTAMHELLVSANTYFSFSANYNVSSYEYNKKMSSRIRDIFIYGENSYQLLDVIKYKSNKYAVTISNTGNSLPEHTIFRINFDGSLLKLEWSMQICKEVMYIYAITYRMILLKNYLWYESIYYKIAEIYYGKDLFDEIRDFLMNVPSNDFLGYVKPKGVFKRKILTYIGKYFSFMAENGEETILDIVEITQNIIRSYYVLSVSNVKTSSFKWYDEPHIWYVQAWPSSKDNYKKDVLITIEHIEKTSLSEDILERFSLIMQLHRQGGLFID